jgi:Mg-chelatase subunit ChlD
LRSEGDSGLSGMDVDVANRQHKEGLDIDILIDIFFSNDAATKRRPLNICFALDKSASMEENGRMEKLKSAMTQIIAMLAPDDYLSIVTYNDSASTMLASVKYEATGDSIVRDLINQTAPGGGTNMAAGMLRAYDELLKHANREYKNRMILMSDGVSTSGERDPTKILKHVQHYNQLGIETSAIGLGGNINFELLHDIAVEGGGRSHFIGDCNEASNELMQVLVEEIMSMNADAENIRISVGVPRNLKFIEVFGVAKMEHDDKGNLILSSSHLSSNQTQSILLKFKAKKARRRNSIIEIDCAYSREQKRYHLVKYVPGIAPTSLVPERIASANRIVELITCIKRGILAFTSYSGCLDELHEEIKN